MVVYVNSNNEIKAVNQTDLEGLIALEVTDGTFDGWNDAKICCYKVNVVDGNVVMLTPYVDSRIVERIDQLGTQTAEVSSNISSEYSDEKYYSENEYCTYQGKVYRFIQNAGRGIEPSNSKYWILCDIATELNRIINLINK